MTGKEKQYAVRVDNFRIETIWLEPMQYGTKFALDDVRRAIAATYNVPAHYIQLVRINKKNVDLM